MSVAQPDLESALAALTNAYVLVGDPTTTGGLDILGAKEGDATLELNEEYHDLTFPEYSGPAVHERTLRGLNPRVTIPVVIGDYTLLDTLSPGGAMDAGHERQQDVVTTSLVLVPYSDFGTGSWEFSTAWSPAAPVGALWFWRGHFERPGFAYREADAGKVIQEVTFQVLWDSTKPDGHHLYTLGDPDAASITIDI